MDYGEVVANIYEAFGRGDMPFILSQVADDVAWESWSDSTAQREGVPWLKARTGHAGVLEFFAIAGGWQIHDLQVLSVLSGKNAAGAEVEIEATVPSGQRFRDQEFHLWTFNDQGKVIRMRHYTDTAKHIAVSRSVSATT